MTEAFLYKWTEKSTQKWYIGSRTAKGCHVNDGYICSSKVVKPLIQCNPDNWSRDILVIGEPIYIRELESDYLTILQAAQDVMSYNRHNADGKWYTTGRIFSDEHKAKMSAAKIGRKLSKEHRANITTAKQNLSEEIKAKISTTLKGRKLSVEHKAKISEATIGRKLSIITCPHCSKEGGGGAMKQWHFANCKNKGIKI